MRKLLPLLMLLLLLPAAALAATSADFTIREMGFTYDITSDEEWLVLVWDGKDEDGTKLMYSPGGRFTGTVETLDIDGNAVTVVVSMFGRETPVELQLDQVETVED